MAGSESGRELADAPEVARRQAATHFGHGAAVRPLEEDRGAIGFEQDHRVIDEAGQDAVEVEAAADVAGDPMERLRTMQLVGDLLAAAGDRDDRADRVGDDRGNIAVTGAECSRRFADEVEDAPRSAEGRDGDGQFGSLAGEDGERRARLLRLGGCAAVALLGWIVGERGHRERRAEHAERTRAFHEPLRNRGRCPRHGPRHEAIVAQLPDRDEVMVVGVAHEADGPGQVVVEVVRLGGQAGDRIDERQVDRVPLGLELFALSAQGTIKRAAVRRPSQQMAASTTTRPRHGRWAGRVSRRGLGRRQEALEIAQPIAPVAARIDPVVAQPTGIAPGSDRVRMHPQQARGLGDGQGGIDRTRWKGGVQGSSGRKCELDGPRLPSSQFLPIVRWSTVWLRRLVTAWTT